MSQSRIRSSVLPSTSPVDFEVRDTRTYAVSKLWQQRTLPTHMAVGWALVCLALVLAVSPADGQMDSAEIQRQLQQEMGGEFPGGSRSAPPNRIGQLVSLAGVGCAAVSRSVKEHPRIAAATTVGALTTVWTIKEARSSGLLIWRSPRVTLFRPSDVHLSKLLETAAGAPIASPLSGVILCPLPEPDAEEELEDRDGRDEASKMRPRLGLGAGKKMRKKVGNGRTKSHSSEGTGTMGEIDAAIAKARDARSVGSYEEEMQHGRGAVTSVCAGVRVGVGLGLYHKFAQGLANLDVFDGRSDCELLATESSSEDLGSTLGLLTRSALNTWSLSPMRVVIRRETTASEPRAVEYDHDPGMENKRSREGGRRKKSKGKTSKAIGSQGGPGREAKAEGTGEETAIGITKAHRQYTLALSAVEGAGWSGTWVFRVTYDAGTEEVWFQTKLSQRKETFGTTPGGNQEARVTRVNEDMMERGRKHAAVLKTREEQSMRVASLARNRAKEAKVLERDRILNPDKYRRVHRYMREDSYTTGRPTARPVRWGEERRKNDIRLK